MTKRSIIFSVIILLLVLITAPVLVSAQTSGSTTATTAIETLQKQIQQLLSQLQTLQQQVVTLQAELGVKTPSSPTSENTASSTESATPESETVSIPELTRSLSLGVRGDDVRKLQEFLARDKEIYPEGLATGFYGPKTVEAVKRWQRKNNVEAVGTVGPKTITKFRELGQGVVRGLIQQGTPSGVVPPGLLTAPGIQKQLATTTPTIPHATSTPPIFSSATTTQLTATSTPSETIPAIPAVPTVPGQTLAIPATPAQPTTATTTQSTTSSTTSTTSIDTTPPTISGVTASLQQACLIGGIQGYVANVDWATNERATGAIEYGPTTNYGSKASIDAQASVTRNAQTGCLTAGTYHYRITAQDLAGNITKSSDYIFTAGSSTTSLDTIAPSVPTNLSASALLSTQINLAWATSTDNVGVAGYKIYRNGTYITSASFTTYADQNLTPATTHTYTVAAFDASGNVSAQSSLVSATTLSVGPPVPTNFDGATSGDIQSQPPRIGLYLVWNYALQSTTKSFNVYMKKPSDATFIKYTYSDPTNLPIVPGWLPLPVGTTPSFYRQPDKWMWRIYDQVADTVWEMGEYKFYVTVADDKGIESVPTATKSFKFYRAPTIVSPANGSTVSVMPRITITEDPAAVSLGLALYKKNNGWIDVPGWWPAPRDFTYNGPALTADSNPHRLVAYSAGGLNERSLNAVSIFNVSTTTAAISSPSLASIIETLNDIIQKVKILVK